MIGSRRLDRYRNSAHVAFSFASLHVAGQLAAFCAGIVAVHILSVRDYATYTLVVAMGSVGGLIANSGFSSFLMSRGGPILGDAEQLGSLVGAVQKCRMHAFSVMAPALAIATWVLLSRLGRPPIESLAAVALTLSSVWIGLWAAAYRDLLLLSLRHIRIQTLALVDGAARVALALLLAAAGLANPITILTAALLSAALIARLAARSGREILSKSQIGSLVPPGQKIHTLVRAARTSFVRLLPSNTYTAFQGQIAILVLAGVGAGNNVAQVGASGDSSKPSPLYPWPPE